MQPGIFSTLALSRDERRTAPHGGDGQEGRPAKAIGAQIFDHALGVLVPVDDDVLQGAAPSTISMARSSFSGTSIRISATTPCTPLFGRRRGPSMQHLLDGMLFRPS